MSEFYREHETTRRAVWVNAVTRAYVAEFRDPEGTGDDILELYDKKFPNPVMGEQYIRQLKEYLLTNLVTKQDLINKLYESKDFNDFSDDASWIANYLLNHFNITLKE